MSTLASTSAAVSVSIAAGSVLVISCPAGAAGNAVSIAADQPRFSIDVRSGETRKLGPYAYDCTALVTSTAGTIYYSTASYATYVASSGPADVTLSAAAAASTVCEVTITFKDASGTAIPYAIPFDVWLSDATTGAGLTGTTASGTVTNKAASGIVLHTDTAKKALRCQTLGTGVFILEITDSAKTPFKVCVENPATGLPTILTLATANYGA